MCLQCFPERVKQSRLDESEYMSVAKNYKSAEENSKGLEEKFKRGRVCGLDVSHHNGGSSVDVSVSRNISGCTWGDQEARWVGQALA